MHISLIVSNSFLQYRGENRHRANSLTFSLNIKKLYKFKCILEKNKCYTGDNQSHICRHDMRAKPKL